jgi:cell filamentation protein
MLDYSGIIALGKEFPSKKANRFIEWFTYAGCKALTAKAKQKHTHLFDSSLSTQY